MAETLRYRDMVRATPVDTSVVDDGSAARLSQLANAFKKFEGTVAEVGGRMAEQRGAQEGAAAGASGDPQLKSNFRAKVSRYAAAYNNAATRSYLIRAEADLEDTAARIEAEAGTNVEQFAMSFDKVRQKTLAEAPEQMRAALDEVFVKRRAAALVRINTAAVDEQNKFARQDLSEGVMRTTDRIARLRASDDPADAALADEEEIKLTLMIDGAAADGTLSALEADAALVNATRTITSQTVLARFRRELESPYGNPVAFIQRLKQENKTSEALPPDEEEKLTDMLLAELRDRNALMSMAQAAASDDRRERWLTGNREATSAYLAGTLRRSTLQQMVENDQIDPDTARTLLSALDSPGAAKSDPYTLMDYEVNLLARTEEEILEDPALTPNDKSRLVLKLRDEMNGWRGSVPGREAADRIDRSLGILPGTDSRLLSDAQKTKRERALTDWYNSVVSLPAEEREAKAIELAEQIITRTIRDTTLTELERLRARRDAMAVAAEAITNKTGKREAQEEIDSLSQRISRLEQQVK